MKNKILNIIEYVVLPDYTKKYFIELERKNKYDDGKHDLFMAYHYGKSDAYKDILEDLTKLLTGAKKDEKDT